jgi:hypothetical protein
MSYHPFPFLRILRDSVARGFRIEEQEVFVDDNGGTALFTHCYRLESHCNSPITNHSFISHPFTYSHR